MFTSFVDPCTDLGRPEGYICVCGRQSNLVKYHNLQSIDQTHLYNL